MNPLVWLQSLTTFRKAGGSGFTVPELDGAGRVQVSVSGIVIGTGLVFVGPAPPGTIDGSVLWMDTASYILYAYDVTRAKWLSVDVQQATGGRNGTTAAGNFYRSSDGMVLDAVNRGIPVPKGTLTSIAMSRTDTGSAVLDVYANGAVIASLTTTVAGATRLDTVNADFSAGLLSFQNRLTGGSNTQNVQIVVQYRRRA